LLGNILIVNDITGYPTRIFVPCKRLQSRAPSRNMLNPKELNRPLTIGSQFWYNYLSGYRRVPLGGTAFRPPDRPQ